jgi:hypothetical protein
LKNWNMSKLKELATHDPLFVVIIFVLFIVNLALVFFK